MVREELGFSSDSFDSPIHSALAVGASYLVGAVIPVAAYLIAAPPAGVLLSAVGTIAGLFWLAH